MKIELDLAEILYDEFGREQSLAVSIMTQIVEHATKDIGDLVNQALNDLVLTQVRETVAVYVEGKATQVAQELLDTAYTPVDKYGSKKAPTTLREQIHSTLVEQCKFDRRSSSYDQNQFTNAIVNTIEKKLNEFKKEFSGQVDGEFIRQAISHATAELKKKLGVV